MLARSGNINPVQAGKPIHRYFHRASNLDLRYIDDSNAVASTNPCTRCCNWVYAWSSRRHRQGVFDRRWPISQPHALAPWDRLSVIVDRRGRGRERFGRKRLMSESPRT